MGPQHQDGMITPRYPGVQDRNTGQVQKKKVPQGSTGRSRGPRPGASHGTTPAHGKHHRHPRATQQHSEREDQEAYYPLAHETPIGQDSGKDWSFGYQKTKDPTSGSRNGTHSNRWPLNGTGTSGKTITPTGRQVAAA